MRWLCHGRPTVSEVALRPDPATIGYPPTLPVEVALRTAPVQEICRSYGIDRDEWLRLREDQGFVAHVQRILDAVKKDGGLGFKLKAQMQSEELLKTSWKLIHNNQTPSSVKADLIKFTVRAAGLDGSKEPAAAAAAPTLAIQINL
jgi:hypothetical protein